MKGIGKFIIKALKSVSKAKKVANVITIVVETFEHLTKRLHEEGVIEDEGKSASKAGN